MSYPIKWKKKAEELGAGEILLTSMDTDGVKGGFDLDMLNAVCSAVKIPVIASGGCGALEHFTDVFEKTGGSSCGITFPLQGAYRGTGQGRA